MRRGDEARGEALATPHGAAVSRGVLKDRPRLEKVLTVLREARGAPVSSSDQFRAIWTDEAALDPQKADARVRRAISLLRELGLRGAIVTSERGYSLRADVP